MKKPGEQLLELVKTRDLAGMKKLLKAHPEAIKAPRPVGHAGGMAWREGLELLKKHGADLNASWRGYRPLHALIQEEPHPCGETKPSQERLSCLRWLLQNGADPELEAAWPPSRALLLAAFTGIQEFIPVLLDHGARVDGFAYAAFGDLKRVERCIKDDKNFVTARTRERGTTALQCCAASRMKSKDLTAVAKLLLDKGADPNALCEGWSHELDVTYFAAGTGQVETFELLLQRGAKANNALVQAAWQKNPAEFGEIALRHGADIDRAWDGDRPLLNQMIRWGQMPAVFWLLEKGAKPNNPDPNGWTAVHQAASRGNERMLNAVIEAGGDLKRKAKDGQTPMEVARTQVMIRAIKKLLK